MSHCIGSNLKLDRRLLIARTVAAAILVAAANAAVIQAKAQPTTATPSSFEVASIRPNKDGQGRAELRILPGNQTYLATNFNLQMLILTAYDLKIDQLSGGPDWMLSERYNIEAKADRPTTRAEGMLMLQALLAERFRLILHREAKEIPIYALVVEKNGPRMRETKDGGESQFKLGDRGQIVAHNLPVSRLVQWLAGGPAGRLVVDNTGLMGSYDFELTYVLDQPGAAVTDPSGLPDLFTALRQQLGLRLESKKGTVDSLTIEHAERPSEN